MKTLKESILDPDFDVTPYDKELEPLIKLIGKYRWTKRKTGGYFTNSYRFYEELGEMQKYLTKKYIKDVRQNRPKLYGITLENQVRTYKKLNQKYNSGEQELTYSTTTYIYRHHVGNRVDHYTVTQMAGYPERNCTIFRTFETRRIEEYKYGIKWGDISSEALEIINTIAQ